MFVKLALTAAVMAAVVALVAGTPTRRVTTYKLVDDLVATDLSVWVGIELTVNCWIESGSVVDLWRKDPSVSFVLMKGGKRLRVTATTPSTWLVRDQMELVVRGHLVPASDLEIIDAACAAGHDDADPRSLCRVRSDAEHPYLLVVSAINARWPTKYDGCFDGCGRSVPSDVFK